MLLLAMGCAHPESRSPETGRATVRIRNLSDFEWLVALEPAGGAADTGATSRPPTKWRLPPNSERTVAVPAGAYRLRQNFDETPAETDAIPPATESDAEPVHLVAGRSYTWPLATLLSAPETAFP